MHLRNSHVTAESLGVIGEGWRVQTVRRPGPYGLGSVPCLSLSYRRYDALCSACYGVIARGIRCDPLVASVLLIETRCATVYARPSGTLFGDIHALSIAAI